MDIRALFDIDIQMAENTTGRPIRRPNPKPKRDEIFCYDEELPRREDS